MITSIFFVNLHRKTIQNSATPIEQNILIMIDAAELIDNDFLRQFELKVDDELAIIEYSLQDRKIFLTKLIIPDNANNDVFINDFLVLVLETIKELNICVVPTSPPIAKFIRKNRRYKRMLPVGIRI